LASLGKLTFCKNTGNRWSSFQSWKKWDLEESKKAKSTWGNDLKRETEKLIVP